MLEKSVQASSTAELRLCFRTVGVTCCICRLRNNNRQWRSRLCSSSTPWTSDRDCWSAAIHDFPAVRRTAPLAPCRPIGLRQPAAAGASRLAPRLPALRSPSARRRDSSCRRQPPPGARRTWAGRWRSANQRRCWCLRRAEASCTSLSTLQTGSEPQTKTT